MASHLAICLWSDGRRVGEYDFSLHEFIPLVRQLTRDLETDPRVATPLSGYRATIQPHSRRHPRPDQTLAEPAGQSPDDTPLRIGIDTAAAPKAVSYHDELKAFFDVGSSPLCSDCIDRARCPGSGVITLDGRDPDWIELREPEGEPGVVRYFTVQIIVGGIVLHEKDYLASVLQPFASFAAATISRGTADPSPASYEAEFVVRHGVGCPAQMFLEPRHAQRLIGAPAAATIAAPPPRPLVDWARFERGADGSRSGRPAASREQPTIRIEMPEVGMRELGARLKGELKTELGLLLGGVTTHAAGSTLSIVQLVPLVGASHPVRLTLNPARLPFEHLLQAIPGMATLTQHVVGWYRLVDGPWGDAQGIDPAEMSAQERELHRMLFQAPWQVAWLGAFNSSQRFYMRYGQDIVPISHFRLSDA
jgi:hypothetical protein